MKRQIDQVRQFQAGFNVRQPIRPELLTDERWILRLRLLQEELKELETAFINNDLTDILDAYVDIDYVLKGAILESGFGQIYPIAFNMVHENNMGKLENGTVRDDGKLIKPEGWKGPELHKLLIDNFGTL